MQSQNFCEGLQFVLVIQKRCDGHRLSRLQGRCSTSGRRNSGANLKTMAHTRQCRQGIHDNNLTNWVTFCFKVDFGTLRPGEQN